MSKENSKQQKQPKTALQLAQTLINWGITVNEWETKQVLSDLDEMKNAYLCSAFADNKEDRRNVIFHHSLLERLLKDLKKFTPENFQELSNLKIQEPCTGTA